MNKRLVLAVFLSVFLSLSMFGILFMVPVKSYPADIIVPDDYKKIQWAIGNASDGDTIFVRAGTYYEHVSIGKDNLKLLGENRSTTIIDGNGTGTVITISASNVMVSQFTIQNSALTAHGVGIFFSNHNMLINNTIRDNYEGIYLYETSNNTLRNNNMTGNKYNFGVKGASLLHFIHDIDTSNTIDEKLVYYLVNQRNIVVNSSTFPDAGYLGLVNSTNIAVKDLNLTNNHQGVLFAYTTNSTLINVNASNNRYGFYLVHCDNDSISGNVINSNYWDGIYLRSCSNITITENSLTNNVVGIRLEYFGDNIISGNNLQNNAYTGIFVALSNSNIVGENVIAMTFPFEDYGHGIWLDRSSNNIVKSNTITSNKWQAIILQDSASNEVFSNTVTSNGVGIYLDSSTGNLIYHNNFVDNTVQVNSTNSANIWDDGYPSGGNYWSDYTGVDVKSGPNQDQPSSDGIGDIPYVIDGNNRDNYPLMYPWGSPSPPLYTLTIYSSPTGVMFTVDGISRTTPWSGTYSEGASVSLVMPETHDGYVWSHWLEDGDTNRTKTITLPGTTWTAVYEPAPKPVGGKATPINIPTNKPELQTTWIWLTTIILSLVLAGVYVKKRKRNTRTLP